MQAPRLRTVLAAAGGALVLAAAAAAAGNPVVAALQKSATARSSVGTVSSTTIVTGLGSIAMTGTLQQSGKSVHIRLRGGGGFSMEEVGLLEDGEFVIYLRSPLLQSDLPPGKTWLKVNLQSEGAKLGIDFSSLLGSSSQPTRILEFGLVRTVRLGAERVAGRTAVHYQATVDYDRAARVEPALAPTIAKLEKLAGVTSLRLTQDVWVGADGRVRRQRSTTPGMTNGKRTTTTQTLTYTAYDVPVRITAPPAAAVFTP